VTWKEVEQCLKKNDLKLLVFESEDTLKRVEKHGDLFAPVLKLKQKLPKPSRMSAELAEHYERYAPKSKPAGSVRKASGAKRKSIAK
jgi:hypothetical protein